MNRYDKVIFDFDDTIWSREPKDIDCSIYNVNFIKENLSDRAIIISGNSFRSIKEKLDSVDLTLPAIWADANSILYEYGLPTKAVSGCDISEQASILMEYINKENLLKEVTPQIIGANGLITNIKYRPIKYNREEIVDNINSAIDKLQLSCIAKTTGKSTIDIVSIYNSKILVYNYLELNKFKTLYIGDEIDSGNDKDISELCTRRLRVNSVYETKAILDCFGGKL